MENDGGSSIDSFAFLTAIYPKSLVETAKKVFNGEITLDDGMQHFAPPPPKRPRPPHPPPYSCDAAVRTNPVFDFADAHRRSAFTVHPSALRSIATAPTLYGQYNPSVDGTIPTPHHQSIPTTVCVPTASSTAPSSSASSSSASSASPFAVPFIQTLADLTLTHEQVRELNAPLYAELYQLAGGDMTDKENRRKACNLILGIAAQETEKERKGSYWVTVLTYMYKQPHRMQEAMASHQWAQGLKGRSQLEECPMGQLEEMVKIILKETPPSKKPAAATTVKPTAPPAPVVTEKPPPLIANTQQPSPIAKVPAQSTTQIITPHPSPPIVVSERPRQIEMPPIIPLPMFPVVQSLPDTQKTPPTSQNHQQDIIILEPEPQQPQIMNVEPVPIAPIPPKAVAQETPISTTKPMSAPQEIIALEPEPHEVIHKTPPAVKPQQEVITLDAEPNEVTQKTPPTSQNYQQDIVILEPEPQQPQNTNFESVPIVPIPPKAQEKPNSMRSKTLPKPPIPPFAMPRETQKTRNTVIKCSPKKKEIVHSSPPFSKALVTPESTSTSTDVSVPTTPIPLKNTVVLKAHTITPILAASPPSTIPETLPTWSTPNGKQLVLDSPAEALRKFLATQRTPEEARREEEDDATSSTTPLSIVTLPPSATSSAVSSGPVSSATSSKTPLKHSVEQLVSPLKSTTTTTTTSTATSPTAPLTSPLLMSYLNNQMSTATSSTITSDCYVINDHSYAITTSPIGKKSVATSPRAPEPVEETAIVHADVPSSTSSSSKRKRGVPRKLNFDASAVTAATSSTLSTSSATPKPTTTTSIFDATPSSVIIPTARASVLQPSNPVVATASMNPQLADPSAYTHPLYGWSMFANQPTATSSGVLNGTTWIPPFGTPQPQPLAVHSGARHYDKTSKSWSLSTADATSATTKKRRKRAATPPKAKEEVVEEGFYDPSEFTILPVKWEKRRRADEPVKPRMYFFIEDTGPRAVCRLLAVDQITVPVVVPEDGHRYPETARFREYVRTSLAYGETTRQGFQLPDGFGEQWIKAIMFPQSLTPEFARNPELRPKMEEVLEWARREERLEKALLDVLNTWPSLRLQVDFLPFVESHQATASKKQPATEDEMCAERNIILLSLNYVSSIKPPTPQPSTEKIVVFLVYAVHYFIPLLPKTIFQSIRQLLELHLPDRSHSRADERK